MVALLSPWDVNPLAYCSEKAFKGRIDLICDLCDPQW